VDNVTAISSVSVQLYQHFLVTVFEQITEKMMPWQTSHFAHLPSSAIISRLHDQPTRSPTSIQISHVDLQLFTTLKDQLGSIVQISKAWGIGIQKIKKNMDGQL
jgi:hypothetical protein